MSNSVAQALTIVSEISELNQVHGAISGSLDTLCALEEFEQYNGSLLLANVAFRANTAHSMLLPFTSVHTERISNNLKTARM